MPPPPPVQAPPPEAGGNAGAAGATPFLATPRQETSKDLLELTWDYPVFAEEPVEGSNGKRYVFAEKALPRDRAFAEIAGDDPRPLLVMRECDWCGGTDDALLNKRLDNETTLLMARWFHCVKVSNRVLTEDHPFYEVFSTEDSPHLLISTRDGSEVITFDGAQSPSDLWTAMEDMLAITYEGRVDKSIEAWRRLLDEHDTFDVRQNKLEREFDDEIETKGPKSRELKALKKDLDKVAKDRAKAEKRLEKGVTLRPKVGS